MEYMMFLLLALLAVDLHFASGSCAIAPDGLGNVAIPASWTYIGSGTFSYCSALRSVTFEGGSGGSQLQSIHACAFIISGLTSITLPRSVREIGFSAFEDTNLTEISIPRHVSSIGRNAFTRCKLLTSLVFEEGTVLKTTGAHTFQYSGLTSVTIPSTFTEIGEGAFRHNRNLRNVEFEGNSQLQSIGKQAFEYTGLRRVEVPEGLVSLGASAFASCEALFAVDFGKTPHMREIGNTAFGDFSEDINVVDSVDRAKRVISTHLRNCTCGAGRCTASFQEVVMRRTSEFPVGMGACINCTPGQKYSDMHNSCLDCPLGHAACPTGDTCSPGYTGIACSHCSKSFYELNNTCESCPPTTTVVATFLVGALCCLFLIVGLHYISGNLVSYAGLATISVNHFQTVGVFLAMNSECHDIFYSVVNNMRVLLSLTNVEFFIRLDCFTDFSYHSKWALLTAIHVAVLAGVYFFEGWDSLTVVRSSVLPKARSDTNFIELENRIPSNSGSNLPPKQTRNLQLNNRQRGLSDIDTAPPDGADTFEQDSGYGYCVGPIARCFSGLRRRFCNTKLWRFLIAGVSHVLPSSIPSSDDTCTGTGGAQGQGKGSCSCSSCVDRGWLWRCFSLTWWRSCCVNFQVPKSGRILNAGVSLFYVYLLGHAMSLLPLLGRNREGSDIYINRHWKTFALVGAVLVWVGTIAPYKLYDKIRYEFKQSEKEGDPENKKSCKFFYLKYKSDCWYWEPAVEMSRKWLLVFCVTFVPTGQLQAVSVIFLTFVYWYLHWKYLPYRTDWAADAREVAYPHLENNLQHCMYATQVVLLLLMLRYDSTHTRELSSASAASAASATSRFGADTALLLWAYFAPVVILAYGIVRTMLRERKRKALLQVQANFIERQGTKEQQKI